MAERGLDVTDGLELAPGLSVFDRSLIRLLQADGRRSFAQLSQELGVAQKTIRRRVRELHERGTIRITTVGDPELMGYRVTALVGLQVGSTHESTEVASRLAAAAGAFYVVVVTGRYNVLVELSCRNTDDLLATVQSEIATAPGVLSHEIHPYLRLHYQNPSFEAARTKAIAAGEIRRKHISFDHIDREIITRLNEDGREPYQTIARDLGVSESHVRQRVRRMTSAGALRIMALTIPRGVGFETVALIGVQVAGGASIDQVATDMAALPAVIYVAICAGRYQIFAEVVCTDAEDLLQLLDTQLRVLPGVASLEPWTYLRLFYRSVRPAPDTGDEGS
jgi:DNA-binding Lrp family transcriptional regulator